MSTLEYPPEDREPTPRGASKAEAVQGSVADMYCMCELAAPPDGQDRPVWRFEGGYWCCSRPDLDGHDVSEAPPTVPGLIPCQPVFPWRPSEHPELAQATADKVDLERLLDDNGVAVAWMQPEDDEDETC